MDAGGLTALADAAGLAAMISLCDAPGDFVGVLPLGTVATVEFRAPGRGVLTGRCALSDEERDQLLPVLRRERPKARLRTTTEITDEHGAQVAVGTFAWSVRRGEPAITGRR